MPISPELKAQIDALPYGDLRVELLETLNSPRRKRFIERARSMGNYYATDESIFANIVNNYMGVMAQRALREARMYRWRGGEVIAFIEHFRKEMPQMYAGYLEQERNGRQIDFDLASDMERLAEQWHPGLDDADYADLFGMVRDYAQAHLI